MRPSRLYHSLLFRNLAAFLTILVLVVFPILYAYLNDIERILSEKLSSELELIAQRGLLRLNAAQIVHFRGPAWETMPQFNALVETLAGIQREFTVDNAVVYRRSDDRSFVYVADGHGNFRINEPVALHKRFPGTEQAAHEAWDTSRPGTTRIFRSGDSKWFQVNVPIHNEGRVVAVLMLNKFATPIAQEIRMRQNRVLLLAVVILTAGLVIRWMLTRYQFRPLLLLRDAARQIARGDLNVTLPETEDQTEIGDLSHTFGKMVADLRASRAEVEDYQRTLERRIEERTREIRDLMHAQVHQAERLEAIGTLASGIAHDLNNILTPIIGYTELVLSRTGESSQGKKNLEDLDKVLTASHRARELTSRILHFARATQGERRPTDLGAVVNEVYHLMRSTLPKSVEMRLDIEPGLALIIADATQIVTALVNLCVNAGHAMPGGGTLRLAMQPVALSGHRTPEGEVLSGDYICITIADTGSGIAPEVMAHMYEPFFTTKEAGKGTGLGLPNVRGAVIDHGGFLEVDSHPEQGAEFRMYLPRIHEEEGEELSGRSADPADGENILFLENEDTIRTMGQVLLESLGYRVTVAADPLEALEMLRRDAKAFDLIIAADRFPHLRGENLAEELAAMKAELPFILTTGLSNGEPAGEPVTGAVSLVLPKPFTRAALGQAVRKVLDAHTEPGS